MKQSFSPPKNVLKIKQWKIFMLKSKGRQANKLNLEGESEAWSPGQQSRKVIWNLRSRSLLGDPYTLGRDGTMSLWLLVPGWDPSSIIHSDIYHGALISQCYTVWLSTTKIFSLGHMRPWHKNTREKNVVLYKKQWRNNKIYSCSGQTQFLYVPCVVGNTMNPHIKSPLASMKHHFLKKYF